MMVVMKRYVIGSISCGSLEHLGATLLKNLGT